MNGSDKKDLSFMEKDLPEYPQKALDGVKLTDQKEKKALEESEKVPEEPVLPEGFVRGFEAGFAEGRTRTLNALRKRYRAEGREAQPEAVPEASPVKHTASEWLHSLEEYVRRHRQEGSGQGRGEER